MTMRRRQDRESIRTVILTLRLTEEEMLRFKLAAIGLKTHRAKLVRERIHDLIGMAPSGAGSGNGLARGAVSIGAPVNAPVTQETASGDAPMVGQLVSPCVSAIPD